MFFKLPFRAMYRPPRKSQGSEVNRRAQGQERAHEAAAELSNDPNVIALWKAGNDKELIALCKRKEFEVGEVGYVTTTMIYTSLKGLLRSK